MFSSSSTTRTRRMSSGPLEASEGRKLFYPGGAESATVAGSVRILRRIDGVAPNAYLGPFMGLIDRLSSNSTLLRVMSDDRVMRVAQGVMDARSRFESASGLARQALLVLRD